MDHSVRTPHTDPLCGPGKPLLLEWNDCSRGASGPFPRETATCPWSTLLLRKRLRRRSPRLTSLRLNGRWKPSKYDQYATVPPSKKVLPQVGTLLPTLRSIKLVTPAQNILWRASRPWVGGRRLIAHAIVGVMAEDNETHTAVQEEEP